jgi:hypothetical protein
MIKNPTTSKTPQAKIKGLLHIKDQAFYYEVHVLELDNSGRSYFFISNRKLSTKKSITNEAKRLKIIDEDDANFTDYAHAVCEEDYVEAQG